MKKHLFLILFLCTGVCAFSQPFVEKLNRGVIAMRLNASEVYISWRMLATDPVNVSYNLYHNGVKLAASPFTTTTNYVHSITTNGTYYVRAIINGVEQPASASATVWASNFLDISLQVPAGGTTPDGVSFTYSPNDCSVGDVDGDGQYEIFVKWDPSNAKDNSQSGYTGNVYIDCYRLNSTRLWRINLGRNIRAGAHYTQFMVYDFDSDGKAEMACKTADGTVDGTGVTIGSATADYRNSSGYILSGPEYMTMFNGLTGQAMGTTNYIPARGTVSSWGDNYGNRVDRFVAAVAYLDGVRPSLIMGRGYYTRLVRVAWDWRNGQWTQRWIFDSNTSGNSAYAGMGNHQMTVGDVDNDGRQEIFNGSSAIDDNGARLWSNGLGHGDALHMSDMDPDIAGQEMWQCHEEPAKYGSNGLALKNARTGAVIWGVSGENSDVGRCNAADIDPRYKGYEMWGSKGGLYTCKGVQITTAKPSMNFSIWWDADLNRELLDGNRIDKWDFNTSTTTNLLTATGFSSNNSTKATPCLSADLFGDWREEVIFRNNNNASLRIFTTNIRATQKLYTLMQNTQYRVAIAWQNSGYNQPPHPSMYIGVGMAAQTQPSVVTTPGTAAGRFIETPEEKSITPAAQPATVSLSPNPTSGDAVIRADGPFTFSIQNISGQILETGKGNGMQTAGQQLSRGTYIIRIVSAAGTQSIKFMKL